MECNKIKQYTNRLDYIDLLRFFCILIMVMGHIGFGDIFDKWIHSFHMPMWFFISGYFCNNQKSIGTHILKRIKSMLIPYLLFGVVFILINGFLTNEWRWLGLLFPNNIQIPLNGALWFLPALFIADLVSYSVIKLFPKYFAIILLVLIGVVGSFSLFSLPFAIDSAIVGVGFYAIGYCAKSSFNEILHLKWWQAIMMLGLCSGIALLNRIVNMRANSYGIIPLFWITAIGMCFSLWNISQLINSRIKWQVLREIGSESIIYVCINQFIIFWLAKLRFSYIPLELLWKVVMVVMVLLICFFINRGFRKTPLKVLLGN